MTLGGADPALFTDLYELTMAAAYEATGIGGRASFELFVRALPPSRNFLVVAGLEAVVDALRAWRFGDDALRYLRSLALFEDDFIERLSTMSFTGDLRAIPEGEIAFAGEPLLEATGPLIEVQLLETLLLNLVGTATMQASKAARVAIAALGKSFLDFSARRDHGVDAALTAARSACIAGAAGTSLVEAGRRHGLALNGTMAHAFVMACGDEREAFRRFARTFPDNAVLLLDTWDTIEGAHHAVDVAREGYPVTAVRLDSGDLDALSRAVRSILDDGGCHDVRIVASGDLDEHRVAALVDAGAPIDGFGVGTRMGTSADAPYLGVVYKLVEDDDGPKLKLAEGKATLPGRKQVFRNAGFDVLALRDEPLEGRPLLVDAMVAGDRVREPEPVSRSAERCRDAIAALPAAVRSLDAADPPYDVRVSAGLRALRDELAAEHGRG